MASVAILFAAASACKKEEVYQPPKPNRAAAVALPIVRFTDATAAAGIEFRHVSGATGNKWMPETMGGGLAVLDYNRDGRPDLLFVSSAYWPGDPRAATQTSALALYENLGAGAAGAAKGNPPRFRDVTAAAGLALRFYGMGAAVGDADNDGWEDLYVTGLGGNHFFRNRGGRFVEESARAGIAGDGWGTSAAFFDYDSDGWLDLFVCRYVEWSPDKDLFCTLDGASKSYCTPERYPGTTSRLYRNRGDGTFADVTRQAGIENPNAKALGVAARDMNGDGKIDFAVANDTAPNNLYRNNGDGTFTDIGIEAGVAVGETGRARGAMGIAWGDAKNDAGLTLAIGNFANELKSVYTTHDGRTFFDESPMSNVGPTSLLALTFGVLWFDYDLDGRLDLLFANGHVEPSIQEVQKNVAFRQPPILYWNSGGGKFANAGAAAGEPFALPMVGRGAASADFDGDGDVDLALAENGGPAHLLLNGRDAPRRSVRVRLLGGAGMNRDAVGARAEARIGKHVSRQEVSGGHGYLSASEKTLTFGLGDALQIDELSVRWPNGTESRLANLAGGQLYTIEPGKDPVATPLAAGAP